MGVAYVKVVASKTSGSYPTDGSVGIASNNDADTRRTLWSFGEAAAGPTLKNMVRHQSRPASLVGSSESPSVIAVEILEGSHGKTIAGQVWLYLGYLVEPHVITEVGIVIEYIAPSIGGPSAVSVARKDMNDAVLNLLSNFHQVHVFPASCWAFDLRITDFSI